MLQEQTATTIFADDALRGHAQAIARPEHGDIRDAAEKAWRATQRSTDALILARTGAEPATIAITINELDDLAGRDASVKSLVGRYSSPISQLHGACFCNGICNSETERRIRETADYLRGAERRAA